MIKFTHYGIIKMRDLFCINRHPTNRITKPFPPISIGDSIDWEDPDPYTIFERITSKTESGSILLFHNDLENTTEALPEILTELLQSGFEFAAVEDMIYTEDYYIDNTGKQIYEPKTSAVTPVVLYADDPYANSAFEKMRQNLTLEEIYNLSVYGELKLDVIEKNSTYLTKAEIAALYEMSYEELYAAYIALVYAAETYGAAGGETTGTTTAATTPEPVQTTAVTTTVTTIGDKTDIIYDKTDVTSGFDKTEVTSGFDKTEAITTYADKTEIVTGHITGVLTGDKTEVSTMTYPEKTEEITTTTTIVTSTTTTAPPTTTFTGEADGDMIIVTTDPK